MICFPRNAGSRIAALLLSISVLLGAQYAGAATPADEARETLRTSLDAVFTILNDPHFKNDDNRQELLDTIEGVVRSVFDYNEFSARTVGRNWSRFSADQQQRFVSAFADLLRATYIERIKGYSGNGVTYSGERMSTKGDKVEVQTLLDYQGKTVPVDYRMVHKQKWVIYDVIVEGVSLVKNYRTQFQELMGGNGDAEMLIDRVKTRAEEVRSQNGKTE